jgi:hypothetical protein
MTTLSVNLSEDSRFDVRESPPVHPPVPVLYRPLGPTSARPSPHELPPAGRQFRSLERGESSRLHDDSLPGTLPQRTGRGPGAPPRLARRHVLAVLLADSTQ